MSVTVADLVRSCALLDGSTRKCKRIYRPDTQRVETHLKMQTRVQELMIELTARQERV